jgi:uncharacterized membrane protein YkvA (DUF1232 family)
MKTGKIPEDKHDFYLKLRKKITNWINAEAKANNKYADYLLFAPDFFHLLVKLSLDDDVPVAQKIKLGITIAYFISPIDILPEGIIGPVGYFDDLVLAAYTLNSFINENNTELVYKHWAGERDVLELIQKTIRAADRLLGSGLLNRLKRKL